MKLFIDRIISQVATFLGRDDIAEDMKSTIPDSQTIYVYTPERALLLDCVNFTAREIAEEHFPLTRVETKTTDDQCRVMLSSFDKQVFRIISVLDSGGRNTTFRTFDEFVKLCSPNSSFEFVYEYLPPRAKFGEYIEAVSMVTDRTLALGAAAAFSLASGLYDEAKMWDAKYKAALDKIKNKFRGERRVPRNM